MTTNWADRAAATAASLPCWRQPVTPQPLPGGGRGTASFRIDDGGRRYLVKIAGNDPAHGVRRSYEAACSRAAHAAGIAPEVAFAAKGALVLAWVEGQALTAADLDRPAKLAQVAALLRRLHGQGWRHLAGRAPFFWVFHALRDYARRLAAGRHRLAASLPGLLALADELAPAVGPVQLALCHNRLAPDRFLDDGRRLWLVGWDQGGYDTPWFDLACLASGPDWPGWENWAEGRAGREALAAAWLGRALDTGQRRRLDALTLAALLRQALAAMMDEMMNEMANETSDEFHRPPDAAIAAARATSDRCLQRCQLAAAAWRRAAEAP